MSTGHRPAAAGPLCYDGLPDFQPPAGGCVLCIGNFDGVHLGHQALLARTAALADRLGALPLAITFEPHPIRILAPQRAPARLTTPAERAAYLAAAGARAVIFLAASRELLHLSPDDFLQQYVLPCRPRGLVEGPTFRFGRDRAGDLETLAAFARRHEIQFEVVPEVTLGPGPDAGAAAAAGAVNSSAIRSALSAGRIADATAMLGRPYRLRGVVGHGEARGAQLGFPTANLEQIETLLPQLGVYAAAAETADGGLHLAAVNIGPQPTFGGQERRVEAHLLDFAGDLRGTPLALHVLARLRDQVKFESVAALTAQLAADVAETRAHAAELAALRSGARPALDEKLPSGG